MASTLHRIHRKEIEGLEETAARGFEFSVHISLAKSKGRVQEKSAFCPLGADIKRGAGLASRSKCSR
jgi:hypothetical protein